jgi:hypothetical protein
MVLYGCKFIIWLIYVNMGMTITVKYGELFDIYMYIYICGTHLGES